VGQDTQQVSHVQHGVDSRQQEFTGLRCSRAR
jgi:hypothetical protein